MTENDVRLAKVGNTVTVGSGKPLTLIAGPCVIENRDLVFEVAEAVNAICKKLGVQYIFKASFDKANRTSASTFRGPGVTAGLAVLQEVKDKLGLPVLTDIHESSHVEQVAEVVDVLQIPAFLCRQTDLLMAAAATGKAINVKKGQFLSPQEMSQVAQKLLEHTDEAVVRGAIRGMAARGDAEAVSVLSGILSDAKKPESLRTEAALNLGEMEQPGVSKILVAAALSSTDESLTEHILTGLGKRPFNETQEFYREYIADKAVGLDAKAAALDALGNTPGPVSTFLVEQCSNPDPRLREAAARSLSQVDDPGNYAPAVITALQKETSPEVRARLYETLSNQKDFDSSAIVAMAKNETNLRAQLGAWHLLADLCRQQPTPEVTDYFGQKGVPALKAMALQSTDAFNRLESVITLRKAKTPESYTALEDISKTATDRRVVEAAQAAINSRPQRSPK